MKTKLNKVDNSKDEPIRTGTSVAVLKKAFCDNLFYIQGRFPEVATANDNYQALAYTIRDRLLHSWIVTAKTYKNTRIRTVCYLSAEYLFGPHLGNNLINLGITDNTRQAMQELGMVVTSDYLEDIKHVEVFRGNVDHNSRALEAFAVNQVGA